MAYGVRDTLQNWGFNNKDIGWDQASGRVTLQGKPLDIQGLTVDGGTSYAGLDALRNAVARNQGLTAVRSALNTAGIDNSKIGWDQASMTPSVNGRLNNFGGSFRVMGDTGYASADQVNKYLDQVAPQTTNGQQSAMDAIKQYMNQTPISPEQIMQSPQFKSMQGAIQSQTDNAMKSAMADLAARGVLGSGSTPAATAVANVQADAGRQIGALIPQLVQQEQSARQQGLANLYQYLQAQQGVDQWGRDNSRYQDNLAMQQASLTGQYQGRPTMQAQDQTLAAIQQYMATTGRVPSMADLQNLIPAFGSLSQQYQAQAGQPTQTATQFNEQKALQRDQMAQQADQFWANQSQQNQFHKDALAQQNAQTTATQNRISSMNALAGAIQNMKENGVSLNDTMNFIMQRAGDLGSDISAADAAALANSIYGGFQKAPTVEDQLKQEQLKQLQFQNQMMSGQ